MRSRIIVSSFTVLFGVFSFIQAWTIASVGASNNIPQLEGDGGGGMVFAALCVAAAGFCFWRWWIASIIFGMTAAMGIGVGLLYEDLVSLIFTLVPLALGIFCLLWHFRVVRRQPSFAWRDRTRLPQ